MSKQYADSAAHEAAWRRRCKQLARAAAWWTCVSVTSQTLHAQDESMRSVRGHESTSQALMEPARGQAETAGGAPERQVPLKAPDLPVTDSDNGASEDSGDAKASDEDVKSAIQLALQGSRFALDDLSVRVDNGRVFLSGSVKSWLAKQRVSTLTRSVHGVTDVVDTIDVRTSRFSVAPLED